MLTEELLGGFFVVVVVVVPYKTLGRDLEEKESTSFRIQHREGPYLLKSSGYKPNVGREGVGA